MPPTHGCFVIAEAGVNHNGDEGLALQLIDAGARAGADAIKFQTFRADRLAGPSAAKAAYQEVQTGGGDQHSMLKSLELPDDAYARLKAHCDALGVEFMSTPFDEQSADLLLSLGMQRIKIPSGEVTNHPFLAHVAATAKPLILSTGMADLGEVVEAVQVIRGAWRQAQVQESPGLLTLLHCTSNYPAAIESVNLRAMQSLADATGAWVGYSDHTQGIVIPLAAVALGACVIEKHFTLDRAMPGPDHRASLEPDELARMVAGIRQVELALGSGVKSPCESELAVRAVVRRSVTLTRDVGAGEILTAGHLVLLRPGTGIAPKEYEQVLGRRVAHALPAGRVLQWDDLAP